MKKLLVVVALLAACGNPAIQPQVVDIPDVSADPDPDMRMSMEPDGDLMSQREDLSEWLSGFLDGRPLPALAVAVVERDQVVASGVTGVRLYGNQMPVESGDAFHLGSCTKPMTSFLAARLVDQGVIEWDARAVDVLSVDVDESLADVNLMQLLSHTGGIPAEFSGDNAALWTYLWTTEDSPRQARFHVATALLSQPAAQPPGSYSYSNASFMIAGAMLEAAADSDWETLMVEHVFAPLQMQGCGFGPQASPDVLDQPRPHRLTGDGPVPVAEAEPWDNPRGLGPAGIVHCPVGDWAKFASAQFADAGFVTEESRVFMHTALAPNGYALGWIATPRDWAGGNAITHAGSNTLNYAVMWVAPERSLGVLVATNIHGPGVDTAVDELVSEMIQRYF